MTPAVWRAIRSLPVWMRWLLLGQFVNATGSLMWLLLTLYLVQVRDLSLTTAGLVVGANGVGTILGNLTGGSIGDRFGMRRASLVALAVSAVTCAAVPVVGPTWALAALVAVRGLAGGATRPLLSATIASELPADRRREGVALSRSVLNAGTVIGPPLGALLSGQAFGAVFVVDGATTLLLCLLIYRFVPVDDVAQARTEVASCRDPVVGPASRPAAAPDAARHRGGRHDVPADVHGAAGAAGRAGRLDPGVRPARVL